jgi:hypothetical protein
MPCPHLKEVVMLYCDALPVKKMIPLGKLVSADPCLTCNYERCPIYLQSLATTPAGPSAPGLARKES